jgi:hypothetical protein
VAFTWNGENQDNPDIYVKAIGAEQALQLTSDRAPDGSPAWSPDGTGIAFLRDKPGGGSEVRLIPPTGGPERTIGEVEGAWPNRGSRGLPTAAPWPSWIDRHLENSPGSLFWTS